MREYLLTQIWGIVRGMSSVTLPNQSGQCPGAPSGAPNHLNLAVAVVLAVVLGYGYGYGWHYLGTHPV